MNYFLENDYLKVELTDFGAELLSIKGKKTDFEYLWQGNPEFWSGRATVLFPICGRLYEGKYTYEGKNYEMELHGIARRLTFNLEEKTNNQITLVLNSNEQTKKIYPFDFIFKVTYTLEKSQLRTQFTVINPSDKTLAFSVGGHPGFNVPFVEGEKFEDYYLEFPYSKKVSYLLFDEKKLLTGETPEFKLKDGKIIPLKHNLFDNDAIFLCDMCERVTLKSLKNSRSVTVKFEDMTHLGFWHTPHTQAPFICIEPWHGAPSVSGQTDDFASKPEMIHLQKGRSYTNYFDIIINE